MNHRLVLCLAFAAAFVWSTVSPPSASAATSGVPADTNIVFTSPHETQLAETSTATDRNAACLDLLLSNNGFGLGGIYRHQYGDNLYGTLSFSISEAKDPHEVEYVDWYGQTFVPGKMNRFLLMPLLIGVQYRLFADDIVDDFRPFITGGLGPTLIFSTPYNREFFSALGYGQAHYTAGAFIGAGAYFGAEAERLSAINIRYYFVTIPNGVPSLQNLDNGYISKLKDFGGFFITFSFGSLL